jgi:hypothetical protein
VKTRARKEQQIIGYLLGQSSELEQSQIETRYFREQQFHEEILAIEEELICDYIRGALTPAENALFQQHFLNSARRRRKYEALKRLMAYIADQADLGAAAPAQPSARAAQPTTSWWERPLFPQLNFVWSLAAVSFLALSGWWLSMRVVESRNQLRESETQQALLETTSQQLKEKVERHRASAKRQRYEIKTLAEMTDQLQASLTPSDTSAILGASQPSLSAKILEISLRANQTRSAATPQIVPVSSQVGLVRLRILLGAQDQFRHSSYNAIIKTLEGREVLRKQGVGALVLKSDPSLTLDVPVQRLHDGIYVISLTGLANKKELQPAEHFFIKINRS